eukprot:TRINITY_DN29505_c0_g1_i1.p1 TRINITY_DN29505_c0_g1~~TRINITY_DN29505_c0_g1_i1.p1  ORF type:complete len:865 (+),score=170.98 TRINITY_DN29505_c0_g1_i1:103-2697(+)
MAEGHALLEEGSAEAAQTPGLKKPILLVLAGVLIGSMLGGGAVAFYPKLVGSQNIKFLSSKLELDDGLSIDQFGTISECKAVTQAYGNMTYIAVANFSSEFPELSGVALEKISQCVTAFPACDPDRLLGEKDMRQTYASVMGTEQVQSYLSRLGNDDLMSAVEQHSQGCQGACFRAVKNQLWTEVTMLSSVGGWYATYSAFFDEVDQNLDMAFSTALALVEMPSQAPLQVQKKDIWHILLAVVEAVGNVLLMASGIGDALIPEEFMVEDAVEDTTEDAELGAGEEVKSGEKTTDDLGAQPSTGVHDEDDDDDDISATKKQPKDDANPGNGGDGKHMVKKTREWKDKFVKSGTAIGAAMVALTGLSSQSEACASNNCMKPSPSPSPAPTPAQAQDDDEAVIKYNWFIAWLKEAMSELLTVVAEQEATIASNWQKLQRAAAVAMACKMNPIHAAHMVEQAFPGMQWVALGVLMRPKYAVYWQRDYGSSDSDGPSCYYDGTSSGSNTGCQNTGSAAGCYQPSQSQIDDSVYYGQTQETGSNSNCAGSGNVKTQDGAANCFNVDTSACSAQRYVWVGEEGSPSNSPSSDFWDSLMNPETGPIPNFVSKISGKSYTNGWEPFVEQCAYVPKVYTPPLSGSNIDYSNWGQTPSSTSVPCNVFGMVLKTYAFPDCNTLKKLSGSGLSGQCINGVGSDGGGKNSAFFTGNFNQQVFIPSKKHVYSSLDSGTVGCCTPWQTDLPSGCDQIICDCFNLIEASVFGWISDSQLQDWAPYCTQYTQTDQFDNTEFLETSVGASWSWLNVVESGASGWPEVNSPGSQQNYCTCNSPGEGEPNNGYSCTNGDSAYCSSNQVCDSSSSWLMSDLPCVGS